MNPRENRITAAIFDLDGVIVDTAKYHYLAWKKLANEIGIELTLEDNERLKGVSRMDSLEIILALGGLQFSEAEKIAMADKKNTWFVDYVNQMQPDEILPGAKSLLESCKANGIKVALGSSSKNAKAVLNLLNIAHLFDVIVDGTMIKKSKPDPEIFLLGASLLNIPVEQCLVFEDAEAGVEAALVAGMHCIGLGSPKQLGKADLVIPDLKNFTIEDMANLVLV
ncbi:MAG: beta-phosphoglucomutase [Cytophagia bacterium]|nr:beta-phosphoglucomutase [Cytophagia bacterium]